VGGGGGAGMSAGGAMPGGADGAGGTGVGTGDGAHGAQVVPGAVAGGTVDAVSAAWAERLARALAPLGEPGDAATGLRHPGELPETVRLLDELGLARATPTALAARWTERTQALAVFGAGPTGPLEADLTRDGVHHVYVEGPAGSGKTELLRSLAASLAASERTDRLRLILVDGGGTERGEGLRVCTDLPHVETYLPAADPVRMREFAQELAGELKRRAELSAAAVAAAGADGSEGDGGRGAGGDGGPGGSGGLGGQRGPGGSGGQGGAGGSGGPVGPGGGGAGGSATGGVPGPRTAAGSGSGPGAGSGDIEAPPSGTLRLRTRDPGRAAEAPAPDPRAARRAVAALPAVVVLVDDYDALVAPALGSTARPAAGSVVRALDAVAREGARLGMYVIAASGRPERTGSTTAAELAGLWVSLGALVESGGEDAAAAPPGRGVLVSRAGGSATPFQAGRVTGRIPRTTTARPTVVPLEWERMGVPATARPLRELGNGPTDLALLASALQRV
ncbi:hypothetical protein G5C51_41810, partial [Streptomyces sp. A7024]|nr:hypothetical protein [Streptomyces coryli]